MPPIEELQVTNVVQNCNSPIKSYIFAAGCICQVLSCICPLVLLYLPGAQLYLPGAGPPESLKGGREGGALPRTAHRSGGYLGQSRPDC